MERTPREPEILRPPLPPELLLALLRPPLPLRPPDVELRLRVDFPPRPLPPLLPPLLRLPPPLRDPLELPPRLPDADDPRLAMTNSNERASGADRADTLSRS